MKVVNDWTDVCHGDKFWVRNFRSVLPVVGFKGISHE